MKCHAFQKIAVQNFSMVNVMTNSYGKPESSNTLILEMPETPSLPERE
jgi:hypothetical protein